MSKDQTIRQAAETITKELARQGKLIEGGWRALVIMFRLQDAPPVQLHEMRLAYYAGAQHLFSSIMTILEQNDFDRMTQIQEELEAYFQEMKAQQRN